MRFMSKLLRNRRGASIVEYGLLVAGVALMASAATAVLGHKTNDLIASMASVLPGAHADDNGPIVSGKLIETAANADGNIALDIGAGGANPSGIVGNAGTERLGNNLGVTNLGDLVVEAGE